MVSSVIQNLQAGFSGDFTSGLPFVPERNPLEVPNHATLACYRASDLPSGNPTNNTALPNLYRDTAATILGVSASATDGVIWNAAGAAGDTGVTRALSSKHGWKIGVPAGSKTGAYGARIDLPASIYNYMKANPTHQFGISAHYKRTAATVSGGAAVAQVVGVGGTAASYLMVLSPSLTLLRSGGTGWPTILGGNDTNGTGTGTSGGFGTGGNTVGFQRSTLAVSNANAGWTGSTYSANNANAWTMAGGVGFGVNTGGRVGDHGSTIWYQTVIVDLTLAGWSWAQWDAVDKAYFAWATTDPAGDYYGDS